MGQIIIVFYSEVILDGLLTLMLVLSILGMSFWEKRKHTPAFSTQQGIYFVPVKMFVINYILEKIINFCLL